MVSTKSNQPRCLELIQLRSWERTHPSSMQKSSPSGHKSQLTDGSVKAVVPRLLVIIDVPSSSCCAVAATASGGIGRSEMVVPRVGSHNPRHWATSTRFVTMRHTMIAVLLENRIVLDF